MLLFLLSSAFAGTRVVTDHVAVSVSADGSFGADNLGLYFDPDGTVGPYPLSGDALNVGWMYDAWILESGDRTWVQSAAHLGSAFTLSFDPVDDDGAVAILRGEGGDDAVDVTLHIVAPWGEPVVFTVIDVTARTALPGLMAARLFDPDMDYWLNGSYLTNNTASGDVAVGSSEVDGRAWAVSARDGSAGVCAWCATASDLAGQTGASYDDAQPGVVVELGDITAGDSARVVFVYAFDTDALAAQDRARDLVDAEDLDRDGATAEEDCNDLDAWVGPWASEEANGKDDDCDGRVDEAPDDVDEPEDYARDDWASAIPGDDDGTSTPGACSTAPGPASLGALLTLGLLIVARRGASR
jgi:hypothetical protein